MHTIFNSNGRNFCRSGMWQWQNNKSFLCCKTTAAVGFREEKIPFVHLSVHANFFLLIFFFAQQAVHNWFILLLIIDFVNYSLKFLKRSYLIHMFVNIAIKLNVRFSILFVCLLYLCFCHTQKILPV